MSVVLPTDPRKHGLAHAPFSSPHPGGKAVGGPFPPRNPPALDFGGGFGAPGIVLSSPAPPLFHCCFQAPPGKSLSMSSAIVLRGKHRLTSSRNV